MCPPWTPWRLDYSSKPWLPDRLIAPHHTENMTPDDRKNSRPTQPLSPPLFTLDNPYTQN
jgi:hypothetical protein